MTLAINGAEQYHISLTNCISSEEKARRKGTEAMWKREKLLGCGGQAQVFLPSTLPQSSFSSYLLPPLIAVKSVDAVNCNPLKRENQILEELGGCESIIEHYGDKLTLENGQTIYNILLEFAEGGILWNQIKTYGVYGLPETQVRHYTESIILGLKHIHDHGYVHRDIKPDNILICKNNIAKIADFGHSKKLNPFKKGMRKKKLILKGTPLYMAPESVLHGEYGSSCDVWALGRVVLEMLTGKQAWDLPPQTEDETLFSCITSDSQYPSAPIWVSGEARDFMTRCFIKDPRYRWTVDMLLNHPFIAQSNEIDDLPRPNFLTSNHQGIYDSRRGDVHHNVNQRLAESIQSTEGNSRICGKRMRTAIHEEEEVMDLNDIHPMIAQAYMRFWCPSIKRPRNDISNQSVDYIPLGF